MIKAYIIILIFLAMIIGAIHREITFYKSCENNNGIYKIGRMSLCLSKDGRILDTL